MLKKEKEKQVTNEEIIDRYVTELKKKEKQRNKSFKKTTMYKKRGPIIAVSLLLVLVVAVIGIFFKLELISVSKIAAVFTKNSSAQVSLSPELWEEKEVTYAAPTRPTKFVGTTLYFGTDLNVTDTAEKFSQLIENLYSKGMTTLFISLNQETALVNETQQGMAALKSLITLGAEKNISVFALIDVSKLSPLDITDNVLSEQTVSKIEEVAKIENLGGIVLSSLEKVKTSQDFKKYISLGNVNSYKAYAQNSLTGLVKKISRGVKQTAPSLYLGVMCDPVYQTTAFSATGIEAEGRAQLMQDKNSDVLLWLEKKYFDGVFVKADASTEDSKPSFKSIIDWWTGSIPADRDIAFVLSSDLAVKGEGSWKNPDQLTRQLMTLNTLNRFNFVFNSFYSMENDKTEASGVAYKYLTGGVSDDLVLKDLTITSPKQKNVTVYDNIITFVGASDPNFELTLNGEKPERTEYGYFSLTKELKPGKNTFAFTHKGKTDTYTVNYKYVVLQSCSPSSAVTIDSNSTLIVKATARVGSTVTATLSGQTITLKSQEDQKDTEFATYIGGFDIGTYSNDTSLGKVVFKGTHGGVTDSIKGGNVTVLKEFVPPSSVISNIFSDTFSNDWENTESTTWSPLTNPISAGNNLIAQVIKYQIETFDGNTLDDLSQPYNSYLPLGTLDYCSEKTSYDPSSGNTYRALNYGKRVYAKKKSGDNITTTRGTLPSFNKLRINSVSTSGRYTVLSLASYWKAPFTLTLSPQKYYGGVSDSRGKIESATYSYVDIKFSYATIFEGSLSAVENSPVFSKAELIKGTADYTLRLHLRKTGMFYGWTADYDSKGNLIFKFLNPATAQKANNSYGGTLNGIVIAVDAGHGGSDGGAVGSNPKYDEAERNLFLANQIATKLKALGATVVMTRTDDTSLDNDTRILKVKNAQPNLAVSVHRNAATSSSAHGFDSYYFNPYTALPATKIKNRMSEAGTYRSVDIGWHYFFLSRISDCPVVLTENGFMSNAADYNNMMNSDWNDRCADAIVKGIVDYFLELS